MPLKIALLSSRNSIRRSTFVQRIFLGLVVGLSLPGRAQDGGLDVQLRVTGEKTFTAPSDVSAIASSFGGRIAAGMTDGRLAVWRQAVWRQAAGQTPGIIPAHAKRINAVLFSPDAKLIATAADDGQVALWDADTLQRADHFQQGKGPRALSLAFSPDGQAVAVGDDKGAVKVWGVEGQQPARVIQHHKGRILALSFKPRDNNTLIIIGDDKVMSTWNLATGSTAAGDSDLRTDEERKGERIGSKPNYLNVAVAQDGARFAIAATRSYIIGNFADIRAQQWIKLVRPTGEQSDLSTDNLNVGGNNKRVIALSPDGRLLAVSGESEKQTNQMYVRNLVKGEIVGRVSLPSRIKYLAFGPGADGYQVTVAAGKTVSAYPIDFANTGEPTDTLTVVDLKSGDAALGASLADVIRTEIFKRNQYILLNTANVDEMLHDLVLSGTNLVAAKDKLQKGELVLAKKQVNGSVAQNSDSYTLSMTFKDRLSTKTEWQESRPISGKESLLSLALSMTRDMLASVSSGGATAFVPAPGLTRAAMAPGGR